jgi:hypothetical protein
MQARVSAQQQCIKACSRPSLRLLPARHQHLRMLSRAAASTQADEAAADKVNTNRPELCCAAELVLLLSLLVLHYSCCYYLLSTSNSIS